jgi:hypothetical protein
MRVTHGAKTKKYWLPRFGKNSGNSANLFLVANQQVAVCSFSSISVFTE